MVAGGAGPGAAALGGPGRRKVKSWGTGSCADALEAKTLRGRGDRPAADGGVCWGEGNFPGTS